MIEEERLRIGDSAPHFKLPSVDGNSYSLTDFGDKKIAVVMFTCNHCPYVQAYEERLISIQNDYRDRGVTLIAINSNDDRRVPEDNFENMVKRAKAKGYNFPYLRDKDQKVVTAYGARVTPEVYVFDSERRLKYHGRVDDNRDPQRVMKHDLRNAIDALLRGDQVPVAEATAFGCTIKWLL